MPKNLNSFIISDKIIDIMKQKLKKTEEIKKELGFNLCKIENSNELIDDTHCIGTECTMPLTNTCKTGTKVGTFHTHPDSDSEPSFPDLWNGYHFGTECIGGTSDKKIVCYIRKDKDLNQETNKIFVANAARFKSLGAEKEHHITTPRGHKMYMSKYHDLQYTKNFMQKKYFYPVNITD